MNDVFTIEGYFGEKDVNIGTIELYDLKLYVNIPSWIKERNVYDIKTKKKIAVIKPEKFGGLTYYLYNIIKEDTDCYGEIETRDFGRCLVMITQATTITNKPKYESGCY